MAKKKRTAVIAAAAAFAASPQGRKLLNQAKEYAMRPENQQRAQALVTKARTRLKSGSTSGPGSSAPTTATPTTATPTATAPIAATPAAPAPAAATWSTGPATPNGSPNG